MVDKKQIFFIIITSAFTIITLFLYLMWYPCIDSNFYNTHSGYCTPMAQSMLFYNLLNILWYMGVLFFGFKVLKS